MRIYNNLQPVKKTELSGESAGAAVCRGAELLLGANIATGACELQGQCEEKGAKMAGT